LSVSQVIECNDGHVLPFSPVAPADRLGVFLGLGYPGDLPGDGLGPLDIIQISHDDPVGYT
jgi:hypothetical protein